MASWGLQVEFLCLIKSCGHPFVFSISSQCVPEEGRPGLLCPRATALVSCAGPAHYTSFDCLEPIEEIHAAVLYDLCRKKEI